MFDVLEFCKEKVFFAGIQRFIHWPFQQQNAVAKRGEATDVKGEALPEI